MNTKLLVLHGDQRPNGFFDQILALQNEMTESEADWQLISYGNTYHAFTNPWLTILKWEQFIIMIVI